MGNLADIVASVRKKIGETEEKDNRIPFGSDKISKIMDYYQLTGVEIYEMFGTFRKMDRQGTGYINLDSIYALLGEEVGVISPYLERLFGLIKKQHLEKVNFTEFLPVLATFCLYTRQQLISFVFCMLDTDHNGFISKKDMLNFMADERFGLPIFPQNFLLSIDAMELERPDRVSFEQFLTIEQDILFLIYPVTRLQKGLQKVFGGERLWENVYSRILKLEKEEEKKNANFQSDNLKKKKTSTDQINKIFDKLIALKGLNTQFRSQTNHLPIRETGRRGSDSRVKTKLPPLLEFSPKRHNSLVYVKKEFVAVKETGPTRQSTRGAKPVPLKKSRSKLALLAGGQKKEQKIGKSVTSISSGRKKHQETSSRKNSLESINSVPFAGTFQEQKPLKSTSRKSVVVGTQPLVKGQANGPPLKSSISLIE